MYGMYSDRKSVEVSLDGKGSKNVTAERNEVSVEGGRSSESVEMSIKLDNFFLVGRRNNVRNRSGARYSQAPI